MALEADCGSSTVLEALRAATKSRPLVPGACQAEDPKSDFTLGFVVTSPKSPWVGAWELKTQNSFWGGWAANPKSEIRNSPEGGRMENSKFEIPPGVGRMENSKFKIRNSKSGPAFRIPNSEFRIHPDILSQ